MAAASSPNRGKFQVRAESCADPVAKDMSVRNKAMLKHLREGAIVPVPQR